MVRIKGDIVIARPVDEVFDFVADQRNEPSYNPQMIRAEKVTDGPVGKGTRFVSAARSMGQVTEMVIETTAYDRPNRLGSTTTTGGAGIHGTLTFEPVAAGTRMRWSWELDPKGALRLLTPVFAWLGRRQEQRVWTGLKRYLEAAPAAQRNAAR